MLLIAYTDKYKFDLAVNEAKVSIGKKWTRVLKTYGGFDDPNYYARVEHYNDKPEMPDFIGSNSELIENA